MSQYDTEILYPESPVIFLMGPTASGKTALAIDLVQTQLTNSQGFEIISVDSAMVFKLMDIGSAKPTAAELELAPHHLIDFIDPKNAYSASNFANDAIGLINEIHAKDKIPLLTGGTMLYFKALKDGLAKLPQSNEEIRTQVHNLLQQKGIELLHQELASVDAITAKRLHTTDTQRICRALEVYRISGKPISQWHAEQELNALPNPLLSIALAPEDRSILHHRIEKRFQLMLEQGFLEEVTALYERGDLSLDDTSMKCVGYRQIWNYLDGDMTLPEATERAIIATRQLAKRQYTWLRSWPDAEWFDPLNEKSCIAVKQRILNFSQQS
jgi:tRNA dimethylallyltransferase